LSGIQTRKESGTFSGKVRIKEAGFTPRKGAEYEVHEGLPPRAAMSPRDRSGFGETPSEGRATERCLCLWPEGAQESGGDSRRVGVWEEGQSVSRMHESHAVLPPMPSLVV